jgi:hypothetical protein
LKKFNDSIINIAEDELNFILKQNEPIYSKTNQIDERDKKLQKTLDKNRENMTSSINSNILKIGRNILSLDYFNSLKILDIDYLILFEFKTNKLLSRNIEIYLEEKFDFTSLYNQIGEIILNKFIQAFDRYNIQNKLTQILKKSLLILG